MHILEILSFKTKRSFENDPCPKMHMIPIDLVQHIILCINASAGSSSLDTPITT